VRHLVRLRKLNTNRCQLRDMRARSGGLSTG
jgi:hypothetical protein